jgi:hypothetical protein
MPTSDATRQRGDALASRGDAPAHALTNCLLLAPSAHGSAESRARAPADLAGFARYTGG